MFEKKEARTKTVGVRFTEDENNRLEEVSKKVGVKKSDFVRIAILEKINEIEDYQDNNVDCIKDMKEYKEDEKMYCTCCGTQMEHVDIENDKTYKVHIYECPQCKSFSTEERVEYKK